MDELESEYDKITTFYGGALLKIKDLLIDVDKSGSIMKNVPISSYQIINKVMYTTARSIGIAESNEESRKILIIFTSIISYMIIRKLIKKDLKNENRAKSIRKAQERQL